jgi:hypothetical protein
MLLDLPRKEKIVWTTHSKEKMRYYRLSESRVLNIMRKPKRREEGIAEGTVAAMQLAGTKKNPTEIWMMYQIVNTKSKLQNQNYKIRKTKIISAWRYPGITPIGERPILPDKVMADLKDTLEDGED